MAFSKYDLDAIKSKLSLSREIEKKIPIKKQIAYVHEQIFSNGLIPLYLKSK